MNSFLLILIGLPVLEIILMINIGQSIGTINTILLIIFTAMLGIYCARIEGLNTIKSGLVNIYQNKPPIHEMLSGASIAFAVVLLIIPGFITDTFGFILLIPFTRNFLISKWLKKSIIKDKTPSKNTIDGEIVEKEKDEL
ncbi:FxsA family protein [Pelagibacteraceae bacterium]|nr:FxsA family protein [Pelagibacteraceae bacterium]